MATVKTLPLAAIVKDFNLYPRNNVDDTHVNDLARALRAGAKLPPLIVEAKTHRLVDGFHRHGALVKELGDEGVADVELRRYPSEQALFLDAVALNAAHGRKLGRQDQTRVILLARQLKVEDAVIATTLQVPESDVKALSVRVLFTKDGEAHPSKRGLKHLQGSSVTEEQLQVIASVRSAEAGRLCMELTRLLEARLVDLSDDVTLARLRELQGAIETALAAVAA